jgi:hypothetical protein
VNYTWEEWLKGWRQIADQSRTNKYLAIGRKLDGVEFELLRVSRFDSEYDEDKRHVVTSIRKFNDQTALLSRATRDLGIVRVITNGSRPAFVVEPGAQVTQWHAKAEGVSEETLVQVMRAGELGRRVRQRDRKALKNSHAQHLAEMHEVKKKIRELEREIEEFNTLKFKLSEQARDAESRAIRAKMERDTIMEAHERMVADRVQENEQSLRRGKPFPKSESKTCALGTAQEQGRKLTTKKRLPGSYGG